MVQVLGLRLKAHGDSGLRLEASSLQGSRLCQFNAQGSRLKVHEGFTSSKLN